MPVSGSDGSSTEMKKVLSSEQLEWLLHQVTPTEQANIMNISKDCIRRHILKEALPMTGFLFGIHYIASSTFKLLKPRSWGFYALAGFGTLATTSILSSTNCMEELRPALSELYDKYKSLDETKRSSSEFAPITYEALRQANRRGIRTHRNQDILAVSGEADADLKIPDSDADAMHRKHSGLRETPYLYSGTPSASMNMSSQYTNDPFSIPTSSEFENPEQK